MPAHDELLAQATDALYQCIVDDGHWPVAMQSLCRLFDAQRLAILRVSPDFRSGFDIRAVNHDPESQHLYESYYWQVDPAWPVFQTSPVGRWIDGSEMLDPLRTPHREYVHDYALRHGIRWLGGGIVHADAQSVTALTLQRGPDMDGFDSGAEVFRHIGQHIGRASRLSAELAGVRLRGNLLGAALDGLRWPSYVVAKDGKLLVANASGERHLASGFSLRTVHGTLAAPDANSQAQFSHAVGRACSETNRQAAALRVTDKAGQAWILRIVPAGVSSGLPMPCALVYAAPVTGNVPRAAVLRELFRFSAAEAEVATLLAEGSSVKEIAAQRGVTFDTVRTQVRQVLAKAGVRRQSQLAQLLSAVPPVQDGD